MNMKTILCLPMTALLLTTALVAPSAAAPLVPFSGVIEGTEDFAFQPGDPSGIDLKIHGSGGGNSTHLGLGKFTAIWDGDISFPNPDSPIRRTFVGETGFELYAEGVGAGTPPPAPGELNEGFQFVTETMTITGGTGPFEFAGGKFTLHRGVSEVGVPEGNFNNLPTFGSFDGFITTKGPAHGVPEPASMSLALGCFLGLVTCVRSRPKGR